MRGACKLGDTPYNFRAAYNKYLVRAEGECVSRGVNQVNEVKGMDVVSEFMEMLEACPIESLAVKANRPRMATLASIDVQNDSV